MLHPAKQSSCSILVFDFKEQYLLIGILNVIYIKKKKKLIQWAYYKDSSMLHQPRPRAPIPLLRRLFSF